MLRQLAAIVPEVTNLPGDLRQVRLFRSNSLSSDRSYRSRQQPSAAFRGGQLRAARSRACLGTSCLGGVHHGGCCGLESGLFYFAHASSLRLRSAGAHFVRRAVALALARRASEEFITAVVAGWRTARRRRTSCSTSKNAQPQAACVSATNFMASEPSSLWFYVLQDPDAP